MSKYYTEQDALRRVYTNGCSADKQFSGLIHLPQKGPGLKVWGALDYLKCLGYVWTREQQ